MQSLNYKNIRKNWILQKHITLCLTTENKEHYCRGAKLLSTKNIADSK